MKSKINKIIRSAAIATVGVWSLCSCNDFLTITPYDKTVLKDYWKTKDDVDQMVNGAYYKMLSGSIIERFIMWGDYRSDELQKYQSINNSTLDNISNLDLYPSSGYNSWAAFYNVINTCNLVMKHAPAVIEIDPNFAEAYLNRGLARCYSGKTTDGLHDFSKAGELGLYNAYAISKQLSRKK